jgi:hypothetical protein
VAEREIEGFSADHGDVVGLDAQNNRANRESDQRYFDALMSGNLARRRQTKFMPADFKLIEARQPPLKDQYDEWLARIICYAFSVPVSPFVAQVNRATGETLRQQATQEGLVPLKTWIKNALDHVIRECMNEPGLEFVWVGDDAIDPLEQAQTLQILVGAGIKTREEARADLGLAPAGGKAPAPFRDASKALRKFNPHHDEQGQFATADGAVATVGSPTRKPRPTRVQVASLDTVMSDAGSDATSQAIEIAQIGPEPPFSEPPLPRPEPPEAPRSTRGPEVSPKDAAAPSAPSLSEAESTAEENSPGDLDSTDQDEDVEFTIPRFTSEGEFNVHFKRHGRDFSAATPSEYEDQAASFLTTEGNTDILQTNRDGTIIRFNPVTDEFGILGPDGQIHTYYRPNPAIHGYPTNRDYFDAQ